MKLILTRLLLTLVLVSGVAFAGYSDSVFTAQQQLNELYYDAGTEDGLMGPNTRKAIRDFQRDNGLNATGQLDAGTRAELSASVEEQRARKAAFRPAASTPKQAGLIPNSYVGGWLSHGGGEEEFTGGDKYDLDAGTGGGAEFAITFGPDIFVGALVQTQQYENKDLDTDYQFVRFGGSVGKVFAINDRLNVSAGGSVEVVSQEVTDQFDGEVLLDEDLTVFTVDSTLRFRPVRMLELRAGLSVGLDGLDGVGSKLAVEFTPHRKVGIYLAYEDRPYDEMDIPGGNGFAVSFHNQLFLAGGRFYFGR